MSGGAMRFIKRLWLKLCGKKCGICRHCDLSHTIQPIPYHDELELCTKYKGRSFRIRQSEICEDFVEQEKNN